MNRAFLSQVTVLAASLELAFMFRINNFILLRMSNQINTLP